MSRISEKTRTHRHDGDSSARGSAAPAAARALAPAALVGLCTARVARPPGEVCHPAATLGMTRQRQSEVALRLILTRGRASPTCELAADNPQLSGNRVSLGQIEDDRTFRDQLLYADCACMVSKRTATCVRATADDRRSPRRWPPRGCGLRQRPPGRKEEETVAVANRSAA